MVDLITAAHGTPLTNPLETLGAPGFRLGPNATPASFLAANPGWHSEAVGGVNSANGIFNNGSVSLTGIPAGASADYFIIGWSGTYPNLDAAIAGEASLGESAIFTTSTGDPMTIPPGIPVNLHSGVYRVCLGRGERRAVVRRTKRQARIPRASKEHAGTENLH